MFRRNKLSKRMKSEAVSLGLCAQWTADWKDNTTKDELVDKFVTGLDFCIANDWPSTEVMKKDFGDVIHRHGVYVDEVVRLRNPKTIILNGSCDATITADNYSAPEVFARHKSNLSLVANDMAIVHISVFDDAKVKVTCHGNAKVFVYRYGGTVTTAGDGKVIIRNREGKIKGF